MSYNYVLLRPQASIVAVERSDAGTSLGTGSSTNNGQLARGPRKPTRERAFRGETGGPQILSRRNGGWFPSGSGRLGSGRAVGSGAEPGLAQGPTVVRSRV